MTNLGLYLHIPFCKKKCAYCDFYSAVLSDEMLNSYIDALIREIKQWGGKINRPIDTIYLGGGTPSLLNTKIKPLIDAVKQSFNLANDAEITLEINPQNDIETVLENAKIAGVNRLSIGAQSGNDHELMALGRTHTALETKNAVGIARNLGFTNISLDLMIGLPDSNLQKLKQNLDFLLELDPEHISAYILKIEPKTLFYKTQESLNLPDEDSVCEQYLFMCDYLKNHSYEHYEISNFAKKGYKSRHNLKYWKCEEYLGLGPSAHSFLDGKRFYYERDLKGYIQNPTIILDGDGGDEQEQIMLSLRLKEGVPCDLLPQNKIDLYVKNGFATLSDGKFSLSDKGMLVSNQIILDLLEEF